MALSGSFYTNVGSFWRLQLEWTATQSISGNYSDVTARLYWIDRGSLTGIYSSASKTASITIAGSSATTSTTAGLNRNQKKRIYTRTVRVNHSADGSGSFSISAYFDAQVTLGGTYHNRVSLSSRSFTLNTIPRASSITSSASWTAGNNRSVSISRSSTSFTHTVRWQVQDTGGTWRTIKTETGVRTSVNSSFTTAQNKDIFNRINQSASRPSRIQIETFNGSTQIGGTITKTGTVTTPTTSTLTSGTDRSMYVDGSISIGISRNHSGFLHRAVLTVGSYSKTINDIGTSTSWNPSTAEETSLYAQLSNVKSRGGTLTLTTFYEGIQVRSARSYTFTFRVRNSNPTFGGAFVYRDTNTTTTGITGNNQYIIQGKSSLTVEIPSTARATSINGASMARYEVTVNGVTRTIPYATTTVSTSFGAVNANYNISIVVKAIDSRGNSTSKSKVINVLPYRNPTINAKGERLDSFEESTTIKITGNFSPLMIGTSRKNSITTIRYRFKRRADATYSSWVTRTITMSGSSFTGASHTRNLNNLHAWDVQVQVTDGLGTVTRNIVVPVGKPIMFLDAERNSVGINRLPTRDFSFEVDGKVYFNNPNTAQGIMSYVGSTSNTGREWLALRSDRRGFGSGAGINLYNGSDSLYPNSVRIYAGGSGASKMVIDHEGIKFRQTGGSGGLSNVLRLTNGTEYNKHYGSSERIGSSNSSTLAFIQHTSNARTLFFGTNSGGTLNLEATGGLFLPKTSGTTRRIEMAQGNMISTREGRMTLYPNRSGYSGSGVFEIRSHDNKSGYRIELYMDDNGNFTIGHGGIVTDYKVSVNGNGRFVGNIDIANDITGSGTTRLIATGSSNTTVRSENGTIYLQAEETRVVANGTTSTYRPIRASNISSSSLEEYKENIKLFDRSATEIIKNSDLYEYELKEDILRGVTKKNIGFVIGDRYRTPKELIDEDSIDLYSMISLNMQGTKEQIELVEKLQEDLKMARRELSIIKDILNNRF